jgi:hypothetical protein
MDPDGAGARRVESRVNARLQFHIKNGGCVWKYSRNFGRKILFWSFLLKIETCSFLLHIIPTKISSPTVAKLNKGMIILFLVRKASEYFPQRSWARLSLDLGALALLFIVIEFRGNAFVFCWYHLFCARAQTYLPNAPGVLVAEKPLFVNVFSFLCCVPFTRLATLQASVILILLGIDNS